jgi:exopolysaccharide production protein ExoZ
VQDTGYKLVSENQKIHSIQSLRAIAASLVVLDHTLLELTGLYPNSRLTNVAYNIGGAGVYSFFVVSGFVMAFISWHSFGDLQSGIDFLRRRFIRIVPLYWIGTLAALFFHKVSATHGSEDSWRELAYSLFFIPYRGSDGTWSPILPQGWTLNYEIMFYVIFALGLCAPRKFGLPVVFAALVTLVLAGDKAPYSVITYLASPIILWFLFGIALAIIWKHWGLSEPKWIGKSAKFLEPIGDASYSLYLVHGLILTILLRIWISNVGPPTLWLVPISLVVAVVMGWVTYVSIERPLLRLMTVGTEIRSAKSASATSPPKKSQLINST